MLDLPSNLANTIQESVEPLLNKSSLRTFIDASIDKINRTDHPFLLVFTFPFEQIDSLALLKTLGEEDQFQYHWERPDLDFSISAGEALIKLEADGKNRFRQLSNLISHWKTYSLEYSEIEHNLSGLTFLGGFSFFDEIDSQRWKDFGSGVFVIPKWLYVHNADSNLLTLNLKVKPGATPERIRNHLVKRVKTILHKVGKEDSLGVTQPTLSYRFNSVPEAHERWISSVSKATELIKSGNFEKIVLARKIKIDAERDISPIHLLYHLRENYSTSYCFLIQHNSDASFVGCSPERLASFQSNFVLTEALAGSISRGSDSENDIELEKQLLSSPKNLQEHRFVVEAIEKRLKAFTGQIDYPEEPGIRKYKNVQHLYTPITAWLNNKVDPLMVLEYLHPTPAVGGTPRKVAIPYIRELEYFERGWYAGPIGWCNSKGRGEFSVAIRSGLIQHNKAEFYAGCGIVRDSVPEMEWEETNLKLIPMLSAIEHA